MQQGPSKRHKGSESQPILANRLREDTCSNCAALSSKPAFLLL